MTACCETFLPTRGTCGVAAIGRCSTCQKAFCRSHVAWDYGHAYADWCAACASAKQETAAASHREHAASIEAQIAETWERIGQSDIRPVLEQRTVLRPGKDWRGRERRQAAEPAAKLGPLAYGVGEDGGARTVGVTVDRRIVDWYSTTQTYALDDFHRREQLLEVLQVFLVRLR